MNRKNFRNKCNKIENKGKNKSFCADVRALKNSAYVAITRFYDFERCPNNFQF